VGGVVAFHLAQRVTQGEAFDHHRLELDRAGLFGTRRQRIGALRVAYRLQAAALQQRIETFVHTVLPAEAA